MYDPTEVPTNLCEDEQLKINGDKYTVIRMQDRSYSQASKKVVTMRLSKVGQKAPGYKNSITHMLRAVSELERYTEPFEDEERTVIKEKLSAGRGSFSSPDWDDEVPVESIECVTRENTRDLCDVQEGDEIRWNGRSKPLVVEDTKTVDVTMKYSDDVRGQVTIVEAEGDWDNSARYKLKRYSDDMSAYIRDKERGGDQARVERLQTSSRGALKFLKDEDLTSVTIVEKAQVETVGQVSDLGSSDEGDDENDDEPVSFYEVEEGDLIRWDDRKTPVAVDEVLDITAGGTHINGTAERGGYEIRIVFNSRGGLYQSFDNSQEGIDQIYKVGEVKQEDE